MPAKLSISWVALVFCAATAPLSAQEQAAQLGRRYHDPLHGFTIRPPLAAERQMAASPTRLVSWQVRDAGTGAIAWTLTVQQVFENRVGVGATAEKEGAFDIQAFAKALKARLAEGGTFDPKSVEVGALGRHDAIHIAGQTLGTLQFWQRQMWVYTGENRFLVFTVSGPLGARQQLEKTAAAILETVEITDIKGYIQQRQLSLERGQKLLAGLTGQKLAAALAPSPQWFTLHYQGKLVGWMIQTEGRGRFEGHDGFRIRSAAMINFPDLPVRWMARDLFSDASGELDRWLDFTQVGEGRARQEQLEDGLKRKNAILVDFVVDGKRRSGKPFTPSADADPLYLPKVHEAIVYRLVDRKAQLREGYLFASYNPMYSRFDAHLITVDGVERITVDGRSYAATRMSDQKHYDVDPSTIWVDEDGLLLRMQSQDDFVIERSSEQAVLKRYPEARKMIDQLWKSISIDNLK